MTTSEQDNDKSRTHVWTGSEFTELMGEWHAATADPAENSGTTGLRASRREINGHRTWVLLDSHGDVVEVAESMEALASDHPSAHITVADG